MRDAAAELQGLTSRGRLGPARPTLETGLGGTPEQREQLQLLIEDLKAGRIAAAAAAAEMKRLGEAMGDERMTEAADAISVHGEEQADLAVKLGVAEQAQKAFADTTGAAARRLVEEGEAADQAKGKIENLLSTLRTDPEADRRVRQQRSLTQNAQEEADARKRATQASAQASRDAETQVERDAAFRRQKAQQLADELERISQQTIARGNAARLDAQKEAAVEIERELQRQSDEQAKAMLVPYDEPSIATQQATAAEFVSLYVDC